MGERFKGWLRRTFIRRPVDLVEVPENDEGADADAGIRQSILALQDSYQRRSEIEGVVSALESHRRENHFGEKLDAIFISRR